MGSVSGSSQAGHDQIIHPETQRGLTPWRVKTGGPEAQRDFGRNAAAFSLASLISEGLMRVSAISRGSANGVRPYLWIAEPKLA